MAGAVLVHQDQDLAFLKWQQGEVGQNLDLQEGQVDGGKVLMCSGEVKRCILRISFR